VLFAPFKALFQLTSLLYLLCYIIPSSASYILLQNPPAIPTLIVAKIVGKLRGVRVVIDWHNFGWSILKLKLREHPIVYFCKIYEMVLGRGAHANFTVTDLMGLTLKNDMGIKYVSKIVARGVELTSIKDIHQNTLRQTPNSFCSALR
jgi:beta-1,4-mannosyltransferase